jgi:hypothetical protein
LPASIYASEALLAYVISGDGLTEDLRAIRPTHLSRMASAATLRPGRPHGPERPRRSPPGLPGGPLRPLTPPYPGTAAGPDGPGDSFAKLPTGGCPYRPRARALPGGDASPAGRPPGARADAGQRRRAAAHPPVRAVHRADAGLRRGRGRSPRHRPHGAQPLREGPRPRRWHPRWLPGPGRPRQPIGLRSGAAFWSGR